MKAIFNDQTIAESDATILIEGNHYFPPDTVKMDFFTKTDQRTTCPWKGEASYYTVKVDDKEEKNIAWYYPHLSEMALDRVKKDFTDYVAFYPAVQVVE